jgi:hypothetical protein
VKGQIPVPNPTVVFSNNPLAYREAIASAVQALRPSIVVSVRDPQDLLAEVAQLQPHLVVCNSLDESVRVHAAAWLMLYPDGANRVTYCIAGQERRLRGIDLSGLLSLVDEAVNQPNPGS